MRACYIGEISESYLKQWTPQTVSPDQKEPDVYDVITGCREIGCRLDGRVAIECFSDRIQVDWGGLGLQSNRRAGPRFPAVFLACRKPEGFVV